jgi:hypothetical protein
LSPSSEVLNGARMKILFLDVDGVLTFDDGSGSLDPAKLAALSGIIERVPDLQICISSDLACCGRLTFGGGYHTAPPPLPFQALGLAALSPNPNPHTNPNRPSRHTGHTGPQAPQAGSPTLIPRLPPSPTGNWRHFPELLARLVRRHVLSMCSEQGPLLTALHSSASTLAAQPTDPRRPQGCP